MSQIHIQFVEMTPFNCNVIVNGCGTKESYRGWGRNFLLQFYQHMAYPLLLIMTENELCTGDVILLALCYNTTRRFRTKTLPIERGGWDNVCNVVYF